MYACMCVYVCVYVSEHDSVLSIELKFGMYIAGRRWRNPIGFGEYRMNIFFTGEQEIILIHYGLWSQIL